MFPWPFIFWLIGDAHNRILFNHWNSGPLTIYKSILRILKFRHVVQSFLLGLLQWEPYFCISPTPTSMSTGAVFAWSREWPQRMRTKIPWRVPWRATRWWTHAYAGCAKKSLRGVWTCPKQFTSNGCKSVNRGTNCEQCLKHWSLTRTHACTQNTSYIYRVLMWDPGKLVYVHANWVMHMLLPHIFTSFDHVYI